MKMKKWISGVLVLCMLFGMVTVFAACGDTNTGDTNNTNTGDTNTDDGAKDELIK